MRVPGFSHPPVMTPPLEGHLSNHRKPGDRHPIYFRRALGGSRFPLRTLQYRRRGTVPHGRAWLGLRRLQPHRPAWYIHLPLAILGGAVAGALWGAIPGYLKARFGAHEVVNTIMMNWIAFRLSDWLLNGPMKARLPPGHARHRSCRAAPLLRRSAALQLGLRPRLVVASSSTGCSSRPRSASRSARWAPTRTRPDTPA